jgi:hypothetical protein
MAVSFSGKVEMISVIRITTFSAGDCKRGANELQWKFTSGARPVFAGSRQSQHQRKAAAPGLTREEKLRKLALKLSERLEMCPPEHAEEDRTSHPALAASQRELGRLPQNAEVLE